MVQVVSSERRRVGQRWCIHEGGPANEDDEDLRCLRSNCLYSTLLSRSRSLARSPRIVEVVDGSGRVGLPLVEYEAGEPATPARTVLVRGGIVVGGVGILCPLLRLRLCVAVLTKSEGDGESRSGRSYRCGSREEGGGGREQQGEEDGVAQQDEMAPPPSPSSSTSTTTPRVPVPPEHHP